MPVKYRSVWYIDVKDTRDSPVHIRSVMCGVICFIAVVCRYNIEGSFSGNISGKFLALVIIIIIIIIYLFAGCLQLCT